MGAAIGWNWIDKGDDDTTKPKPDQKTPAEEAAEKIKKWTGIDWQSFIDSMNSLASLPAMIITALKITAIAVGVLLGVFFLVFLYRFAVGDTPDIAGGVVQIASVMPQAQIARAAASRL